MVSIGAIATKPTTELVIQDFEALIELAAPESSTLELKEDLQTPDKASGWRTSGSLHPKESRDLAKEIVAFANSYGGRIFIGIRESNDHPKRAASLGIPLPKLATLVERLRDSISALISPVIPQLQIVGVPTGINSDEGYIVIDVPKTLSAPHGLGVPPACYWRRDSTCKPMEMADLQNAFWEARTGRERISEELNLGRTKFGNYSAENIGLSYRFTAVSEVALDLPRIAKDLREGRVAPHRMSAPSHGIADYPLWALHEWRFKAFGTERYKEHGGRSSGKTKDRWRIEQTGIIELLGCISSLAEDEKGVEVDAYDFCATAVHALHLATYLHHYSDGKARRWVFEGEFKSRNQADYLVLSNLPVRRHEKLDLRRGARFRPIAIDLEEKAVETFKLIEDRIWETFGIECPEEARQTFQPPDSL